METVLEKKVVEKKKPTVKRVVKPKPRMKAPVGTGLLPAGLAPVKASSSGFTTLNGYFEVPTGTYKILKRNIEQKVNSLILGPTGAGKTELISNIAATMGLPLTIFDMGTMTDPISSLVGSHIITVKDGVTSSSFMKSRFSEVIQRPGIGLMDEVNRMALSASNLLFPCLDFRRELAMEYCFEDSAPIKVHPDFVFIATANLGSQYTGTHKIDRALLDRFMLIEMDPLTTNQIKKTLKYQFPSILPAEIDKIVKCYDAINKSHADYVLSFNLSLRHLRMIIELVVDGFTIYDSFYAICKGIGSTEGLKILENILQETKQEVTSAVGI